MHVTVVYEPEDIPACDAETRRRDWPVARVTWLSLLFSSFLPLLVLIAYEREGWLIAIGSCILALLLAGNWLWAYLSGPESTEIYSAPHTYHFSSERIEIAAHDTLLRYSWQSVIAIRVTQKYLLVDIASSEWAAPHRTTRPIPLRCFATDDAAEDCIAFCRAQLAASRDRPIQALTPSAEHCPQELLEACRGDCVEVQFRHQDDHERLFDDLGEPLEPIAGQTFSAAQAVFLFCAVALTVYYGLEHFPRAVHPVGTLICVFAVLVVSNACIWMALKVRAALQPRAILNSQVILRIFPHGAYYRTELCEAWMHHLGLSSLVTDDWFIFLRNLPDGKIWCIIPRTAFRDEQHLAQFVHAISALQEIAVPEEVVAAEAVLRSPPSDNPYHPPETI